MGMLLAGTEVKVLSGLAIIFFYPGSKYVDFVTYKYKEKFVILQSNKSYK